MTHNDQPVQHHRLVCRGEATCSVKPAPSEAASDSTRGRGDPLEAGGEDRCADVAPPNVRLEHNWWDTPARDGGRWVLGFRVRMPEAGFDFFLTEPEMRHALVQLKNDGFGPDGEQVDDDGVENKIWWEYGTVNADGTFSLGEDAVDDVPVILYRDDHCNALVPHRIGLEMVEIIEKRLAEMDDPAYLANLKEERLKEQQELNERLALQKPEDDGSDFR